MIRKKDASTRLIKPTLPELFVDEVLYLAENWESDWEYNGEIEVMKSENLFIITFYIFRGRI